MNRNIAIIGIIALLAVAYVLLLEPLSEKRVEMQSKLHTDYTTLVKYRKYSNLKDQAEERLSNAEQILKTFENFLVPQSDTSVAFAQLQRGVQQMADQAGLMVTALKPLPIVEFKNYTGLPIFMDCSGDINTLGNFLKRIDDTPALLKIDKLNIAAEQNGKLRIKIQLTGLMVS